MHLSRSVLSMLAVAGLLSTACGNDSGVPAEAKAFCNVAQRIASSTTLSSPTVPSLADFDELKALYEESATTAPDEISQAARTFADAVATTVDELPGDLDNLEPDEAQLVFDATADKYLRTPESNTAAKDIAAYVNATCKLESTND